VEDVNTELTEKERPKLLKTMTVGSMKNISELKVKINFGVKQVRQN